MTPGEQLYEELRPRAFAIAYRMLGSVGEAEDVVQEGLLRLHGELESGEEIESPQAYLATVVTRLAIDELRSARARRETYVGEWLPEPMVTDPSSDDPARARRDSPTRSRSPSSSSSRASPRSSAPSSCCARSSTTTTSGSPRSSASSEDGVAPARGPRPRRRRGGPAALRDLARAARAARRASFFAAAQEGDLEGARGAARRRRRAARRRRRQGAGARPPDPRARARVARTLIAWSTAAARFGAVFLRTEVNGQPGRDRARARRQADQRDGPRGRRDGEVRAVRLGREPRQARAPGSPADEPEGDAPRLT